MRFRLLGACVRTRLHNPKVVECGRLLSVKVKDGCVWAYDDKEGRIGSFPHSVRDAYLSMPEGKRYRFVEVGKKVDLHDKYGECWVVPVVQ